MYINYFDDPRTLKSWYQENNILNGGAHKMEIEDEKWNDRELEFAIFGIENVAARLNVDSR